MTNPSDEERGQWPLIGRRSMIKLVMAAGVLAPFVGTSPAQASSADGWYDIPEESGSVPWW